MDLISSSKHCPSMEKSSCAYRRLKAKDLKSRLPPRNDQQAANMRKRFASHRDAKEKTPEQTREPRRATSGESDGSAMLLAPTSANLTTFSSVTSGASFFCNRLIEAGKFKRF